MTILAGFNLPVLSLVEAQEKEGIRIQPAIIEEQIGPGGSFSSKLQITNISAEQKTFYLVKRDIKTLSPQGSPIFAAEGEKADFEISPWIQFENKPLILGPGETREISFTIVVPPDAAPGGHFGGIFAALATEQPKTTGISIGYQVGTIINLRVSGEVIEEAQLSEFRSERLIYGKPKVVFLAKVENFGNVLVRPHGILEIFDFLGKKEAEISVNTEGAAVFPKTDREYKVSWESDKFLIGPYKAAVSLVYGQDGQQTVYDTASFWILPLQTLLLIAGALIISIFGAVFLIRFFVRKKLRQILKHDGAVPVVRRHKAATFLPLFVLITVLTLVLLLLAILFLLFA